MEVFNYYAKSLFYTKILPVLLKDANNFWSQSSTCPNSIQTELKQWYQICLWWLEVWGVHWGGSGCVTCTNIIWNIRGASSKPNRAEFSRLLHKETEPGITTCAEIWCIMKFLSWSSLSVSLPAHGAWLRDNVNNMRARNRSGLNTKEIDMRQWTGFGCYDTSCVEFLNLLNKYYRNKTVISVQIPWVKIYTVYYTLYTVYFTLCVLVYEFHTSLTNNLWNLYQWLERRQFQSKSRNEDRYE